ncbi:SDR family NAD(P)-dependent oxidoreductase [Bacillus sp. REN16]|uniref:SDR family NAD(P)-dependent oxidoreductase n=1 Tax=Bacillus sp. REN16 TaxID=2887296 RepID=UPI001E5E6547|nr:SDR family NAD(P)-dependent oxidoreductase [Bacillus sp. REN16]MCC3357050.1 SDR family NAD(P)-dependent oxidoreductase [Bacillus sp. REN16]
MRKLLESLIFLPTSLNKQKLDSTLSGKTILITGASSGIGKEVAYQLADINCHLILVARRGELLEIIKNEIEMQTAKVSIFQADLRKEDELNNFLAFLHNRSTLDIFINNAGLSIRRSIYESLDRQHDFTRTMAINYFVPVKIVLSIIPLLQKSQGQIINVSTINARLAPVPYFAAYQASKLAFDVWLRSVSPELKNVKITSIYLPLVRTPMIEPTAGYLDVPAMSQQHAAKVICKSMYTRRKKYQPWWLIFGQLVSIFIMNLGDFSKKGKRNEIN